jgi:hypothetical protein
MPQIAFHRQAADEMRAAAADYEEGERGLGDEFPDEVEEAWRRIQRFPRRSSSLPLATFTGNLSIGRIKHR